MNGLKRVGSMGTGEQGRHVESTGRSAARDEIEEVMAGVVQRDPTAMVRLQVLSRGPLESLARRHLAEIGRDRDQLLVEEVVAASFEHLLRIAAAWRAGGGAMPWVWARLALRALALRSAGQINPPTSANDDEGDEATSFGSAQADPDSWMEVLARLAENDADLGVLLQVLATEIRPRDAEVFLAVLAETTSSNPAPSHAVAMRFGMTAAAVRQVVHRVRLRIAPTVHERPRLTTLVPSQPAHGDSCVRQLCPRPEKVVRLIA